MNTSKSTGRRVVVAGGSFAGLSAAYALRELLPADDTVTLISRSGQFVFAPSLVWAALGMQTLNSSFDLEAALIPKGIEFIRAPVREVRVTDRVVVTEKVELPYDRLLVATGARPDASAVPGLAGEFREASWIVGEDSAMEARTMLRRFFEDPGPLVVGAAQSSGYVSAAYELALALDNQLRRRGLRHQVPITFVTAEPYLGHLGFGQTAARDALERLFRDRKIGHRTNVHVERIDHRSVKISGDETIPAHAIIMMPPFTGEVGIWKSAGLTDESGVIPVNREYRHTEHPDIYAAGVASRFNEPVAPLGSVPAPQTGYLAVRMGRIAAQNVAASLGVGVAASRALPYMLDVRVLDGLDTGVLLTSRGNAKLQHSALRLPGSSAHYLKAAIERYIIRRLRMGRVGFW
jgi:sulfide:quinone oxidoreductase